jgi:hypothetical protein
MYTGCPGGVHVQQLMRPVIVGQLLCHSLTLWHLPCTRHILVQHSVLCSPVDGLQDDGNLVAKHRDRSPYWDTKSGGKGVGPYKLEIRDDCVVFIRDSQVG